jgi:DNA-binding NtrC family response regulator
MNPSVKTILLHDREEPLGSLKTALEKHSIHNIRARSCGEVLNLLSHGDPPPVIITDLSISDGAWADALLLPTKSPVPVNLIVASDVADLPLWRAAIECGAFKYTMLPVPDAELRSLVQHAAADAIERRGSKFLAKTA